MLIVAVGVIVSVTVNVGEIVAVIVGVVVSVASISIGSRGAASVTKVGGGAVTACGVTVGSVLPNPKGKLQPLRDTITSTSNHLFTGASASRILASLERCCGQRGRQQRPV